MKVDNFSRALKQSPTLHGLLLQFAHALIVQATYTALANARSKFEERLARWLLMAHDRGWRRDSSYTRVSRSNARCTAPRGDPRAQHFG